MIARINPFTTATRNSRCIQLQLIVHHHIYIYIWSELTMVRINIGGKEIEQVMEFCYLGSVITTDAKCHREIRRRIAIGKEAFSKRRELLRGKVNRTLKIRTCMIKTLIWSVVLYGAETWTMRKEDIKRLEAFEMWTWRRMEKVSWTGHKTNEDILETIGEERSLISTIKSRQKKWIGHTLRRRITVKNGNRRENAMEKDLLGCWVPNWATEKKGEG